MIYKIVEYNFCSSALGTFKYKSLRKQSAVSQKLMALLFLYRVCFGATLVQQLVFFVGNVYLCTYLMGSCYSLLIIKGSTICEDG